MCCKIFIESLSFGIRIDFVLLGIKISSFSFASDTHGVSIPTSFKADNAAVS